MSKITVLIENTTQNPELQAEHGLSLLIEFNNKKYLLDAGTTGAFLNNADVMNVSVSDIECAILSHGHYDHAGGFGTYFAKNPNAKLYAMSSSREEYYSGSGGVIHEIGVPKDILDKYGENFVYIDEVTKLSDNVYLVPHNTKDLDKIGEKTKLYRMVDDELKPDDFAHELSVVLDTKDGLLIFNSCSHGGIVNIINEVKVVFPNKNIHAFFGGLHMKGKKGDEVICTFSEEEIKDIADYLKTVGLQKLYTGHCTGEPAVKLLKKYLGDMVEELSTGKIISV